MPETTTDKETTAPKKGQKLRSIMEAASALTCLGDEGENENESGSPEEETAKPDQTSKKTSRRFIPDNKKVDSALTFPEKLMQLMEYADQQGDDFCVAWMPDGKSFIIRNTDDFTRKVVPQFFKPTKFSSFTRKLYRWGFRQVNRGIGPDDPIIFGNINFVRDNQELMAQMRSVTAASARKQEEQNALNNGAAFAGMKRTLEDASFAAVEENQQKRLMLEQLMQQQQMQQKSAMMAQNPALYGGFNPNGTMSLSNALRPNLMGMPAPMPNMSPNARMQPYDMTAQPANMSLNNFIPQGVPSNNSAPYNASSTAEIVNAAIQALRYS